MLRTLLKIALLLGAITLGGGCEQGPGTLGPGGPPEPRAIPCGDDGKDHYGVGKPVVVLEPGRPNDEDLKPYLGDVVAENAELSISESGGNIRVVADWDDSSIEGAWYGVVVYYTQPGANTREFIDGPEVRTTDVSCYAIEADRGFLYFFAVQIRAFIDHEGREIRVGSHWVGHRGLTRQDECPAPACGGGGPWSRCWHR